MDSRAIATTIEKQEWIEPAADAVQNAVAKVFEVGGEIGKTTQDILHGVWLGHQLHPVLTDIPTGAWTVATVLDLLDILRGKDDLGPGAEAAIAIGLVGAAGAAVTGLTDWHVLKEEKEAKRIGFTHAAINTVAATLYISSLICRRRKAQRAGRWLGFLGMFAATASAYLGGTLVYEEELGVDHAERNGSDEWIQVLWAGGLEEGKMVRVEAGEVKVLIARHHGEIYAIGDVCSHLGGPLSEGELEDGCVKCPWHGSVFRVTDGAVVHGPATFAQPKFDVRLTGGHIEVRKHTA